MVDITVDSELIAEVTTAAEREPTPDDFDGLTRHPLYFGISRPIGTHTRPVIDALTQRLNKLGYHVQTITLSKLIAQTYRDVTGRELPPTSIDGKKDFSAYRGLMRAGDMLRVILGSSMAAQLAILEINSKRAEHSQTARLSDKQGIAYIVTHFMHPAEVNTMRAVYGSRFFLLAVNAPLLPRAKSLEEEFTKLLVQDAIKLVDTRVGQVSVREENRPSESRKLASELVEIDAGVRSSMPLLESKHRLSVDDTFHLADVFVTSRARSSAAGASAQKSDAKAATMVVRFVDQIFSKPFETPTVAESAMSSAFLAARSSVALGRSVGATLINETGSVVATGWNEVARPFGGPYREHDDPDHRDHAQGYDPSDLSRLDAISTFLEVLLTPDGWAESLDGLKEKFPETADWLGALKDQVLASAIPSQAAVAGLRAIEAFDTTRVMHLIEFGRSVHAEVAALSDAYRRGTGGTAHTMYVTTFPCHECTRNLISFGIKEIVYVEPYGKSMAESLYGHEIAVFPEEPSSIQNKVMFTPFTGIAPSRIEALFSPVRRKNGLSEGSGTKGLGRAVEWLSDEPPLRLPFVGYPPGIGDGSANAELEVAKLSVEVEVAKRIASAVNSAASEMQDPDGASQA